MFSRGLIQMEGLAACLPFAEMNILESHPVGFEGNPCLKQMEGLVACLINLTTPLEQHECF